MTEKAKETRKRNQEARRAAAEERPRILNDIKKECVAIMNDSNVAPSDRIAAMALLLRVVEEVHR